jgi:crotonobetainyl-CoA:carnitine CoA-transferase CaiB-like acyl-CoA transferase
MNTASAPSPAALAGLRVLDLSRVLAGPWCTQTLADLGADVIKVERPASGDHPGGDDTRGWGPPFLKDRDGDDTAEAAYYLGCNRNKRSITLDLSRPEGQALARRLAARCDVLVENFKVGDMARYGLDAPTLLAAQPRLVYCSITGFGQTGPYSDRAGYDYAVQGLGGLMSVTGDRDATGQGQHIDMALLDTQVAMLANLGANYLVTGVAPGRAGNAHQNIVPYQVFEASDGHLILAVGNDGQFARFCELAGRPELARDPRFARNADRVRHRELLVPLLSEMLRTRSKQDWLSALEAAKVPCGAINNLAEVFADPQVKAREMAVPVAHPLTDSLRLVASPMKLSATPVQVRRAPPLLGQHTDEVLAEIGLDVAELARLREHRIV